MRRTAPNRSSGKSSHNNNNTRIHSALPTPTSVATEMPPVETVVARLETLSKLLHETNQTRQGSVYLEIQLLSDDLRKMGPYLEQAYPDVLDRLIASMRDASASAVLPPALRLAVFELVELRAAKWTLPSDTCNYYRQRRVLKDGGDQSANLMNTGVVPDFPTTPSVPAAGAGEHPPLAQPQKAFRQEVLIKNSDSGKVMGVRGRRISKIEKMSDTIISFEKVDPTAKERVLSINGYSQQSIDLAKKLIHDTIARNASPTFDGPVQIPAPISVPNSLLGQPPQLGPALPNPSFADLIMQNDTFSNDHSAAFLLHDPLGSLLNNNNNGTEPLGMAAPLFNYTVNVGSQAIRVSGNDLDLVQEAKLALDDHFAQKYPQMYYTMHVRTRTTSMNNNNQEEADVNGNTHNSEEDDDGISSTFSYDPNRIQIANDRKRYIAYNRETLLRLANKYSEPPDFSQLDPITKDMIVLKKPRTFPKNGANSPY